MFVVGFGKPLARKGREGGKSFRLKILIVDARMA